MGRTPWGSVARALAVGVVGCIALAACSADDAGSSAAAARAEAYDYPAVDRTDDVRMNLERLQVPDDVLDAMSTEALVWTVLEFPYVGNAFFSSQANGEVEFLAGQCNALRALLSRDDAAAAVAAVREAFAAGEDDGEPLSGVSSMVLDLLADELGPA